MAAKRLLVSLDERVFSEIEKLAKLSHESLSKVAKNLIVSSLELEEDLMLAKLADERVSSTKEWISHIEAWK